MAKIPIWSFPLDGMEEQFGVWVKCSISSFLLIITDLEKMLQTALVEHLRKTEKTVTLFMSVGRFCLTVRRLTIFSIYFSSQMD